MRLLQRQGLTLIELLITLSIIAVISGAVFVAIDPPRRIEAARNTKRVSDVAVILDALKTYQSENDGDLSLLVDNDPATVQIVGTGGTPPPACNTIVCTLPEIGDQTIAASGCFADWLADAPPQDVALGLSITELRPYLAQVPADPLQRGDAGKENSRYFVNFDPASGNVVTGSCDGAMPGTQDAPEPIILVR